ncbi:hypothetical protein Cni_G14416 [Canna indica]|uniref:DUF4283 domain-containing protein n=1 Tax=Canna indica TaxID=4628 RepID=A0AAQ3KGC9_9LILI|nr:hypothetical protein Cni_G14416 [Canna indica]
MGDKSRAKGDIFSPSPKTLVPPPPPPDPPDWNRPPSSSPPLRCASSHSPSGSRSSSNISWTQILKGENPNPKILPGTISSSAALVSLQRIQHQSTIRVLFTADQLQSWSQPWEASLIGKFLGKAPLLLLVRRWVDRLWSNSGFYSILDLEDEFFVFRFNNLSSTSNIFSSSPWSLCWDIIRLIPWRAFFQPWLERITTTPVWIRLHGLPLELWNSDSINLIASGLAFELDQRGTGVR